MFEFKVNSNLILTKIFDGHINLRFAVSESFQTSKGITVYFSSLMQYAYEACL